MSNDIFIFLVRLGKFELEWSDLNHQLKGHLETGVRLHSSVHSERYVLGLLSGLVAMDVSFKGADLRSETQEKVLSGAMQHLDEFSPEGQAECFEL